MKKLIFLAAIAASVVSFGSRMIECGTETKVLSPIKITAITAASTNTTGTVTVTNRIDLSFTTNVLSKLVVTNGWIVQIGREKTPVINTNTVVKSILVEKHVDVPVGSVTLSDGYGKTNNLEVYAAPGDKLLLNGTNARVFVLGE